MAKELINIRVEEEVKRNLQQIAKLENKTLSDFMIDSAYSAVHQKHKSKESNGLKNEIIALEDLISTSAKVYSELHFELSQRIYALEQITQANLVETIKNRIVLDNVYPEAAQIINEGSIKKFVADVASRAQLKAKSSIMENGVDQARRNNTAPS